MIDRSDNTQALVAALLLAKKRFEGQGLVIHGSSGFQAACLKVAIAHGLDIKFADSELDQRRIQGVLEDAERRHELSQAEKPDAKDRRLRSARRVSARSESNQSQMRTTRLCPLWQSSEPRKLKHVRSVDAGHAQRGTCRKRRRLDASAWLARPGLEGGDRAHADAYRGWRPAGGTDASGANTTGSRVGGKRNRNLQTMLNQEAAAMADPLAELTDAQEQGKSR